MGYNTRFTVSALGFTDDSWIRELEGLSGYCFSQHLDGYTIEGSWYDHAEHLTALSEKFPGVVFELHGDGEEQGDVWILRALNGNSHRVVPEVIWPDFPEKFKPAPFSDWIEWYGGKNPAPGSKVQVRLKNGDVEWTPTNSDEFHWGHLAHQSEANIMAYRVIE